MKNNFIIVFWEALDHLLNSSKIGCFVTLALVFDLTLETQPKVKQM